MKKSIFLALSTLVVSFRLTAGELAEVGAEQLLDMQKNQNALVIDVRTEQEWQASGVIPQSRLLQSFDANGQIDQEAWSSQVEKLKTSPDQPVILVCRSGNRSAKLGKLLAEEKGMNQIYHLSSGIQGWIKSGKPVKPSCATVACN